MFLLLTLACWPLAPSPGTYGGGQLTLELSAESGDAPDGTLVLPGLDAAQLAQPQSTTCAGNSTPSNAAWLNYGEGERTRSVYIGGCGADSELSVPTCLGGGQLELQLAIEDFHAGEPGESGGIALELAGYPVGGSPGEGWSIATLDASGLSGSLDDELEGSLESRAAVAVASEGCSGELTLSLSWAFDEALD